MKTQMQINLAVEEIFVNIACYAYGDKQGTVTVKVANFKNEAEITFMDSGVPFNPLQKEDPNVHLSSEERQIGGLGIFIAKNIMDEIRYEYKNGMNQLYMRKCFDKIGTSKDIH
jgi:anti-sigma regulatory factor (Ser/Thr protein kinase)